MNRNFMRGLLFLLFVTSLNISKAQFWQPTIFPSPFPNNGGFGAAPLPTTLLRVNNGSVLFDGTNGTIPVFNAGTRLMWIPELAAFRAGGVAATQWNNIGQYSFATGYSTRAEGSKSAAFNNGTFAQGDLSFAANQSTVASGEGATAFGSGTNATGNYSFATGHQTRAGGLYSAAFGLFTEADGFYSFATGQSSDASGDNSTAIGTFATASSNFTTAIGSNSNATAHSSMAIGNFATASAANSMAIGMCDFTSPFNNTTPFSLSVSFKCDQPTLFVGPGTGVGTYGNVGIGTSNPLAPLHVLAHSSDAAIFIPDGAPGSNPVVRISDPFGYPGISMNRNGNRGDVRYSGEAVEIVAGTGTGGRGVMFRVTNWNSVELFNGNYTDMDLAGGGTTGASLDNNGELIRTPSDIRLKEEIVDLEGNMDKIKQLRPVSYNYIDKEKYGNGRTIGFIAQEVEKVLPEVVKKAADDYQLRSLNYVEIIPVLTGAMQEQAKVIDGQKTQIDELLKRVETLEATCAKNGDKSIDNASGAYLKQNMPNPSAQNTVIKFYLPATVASASINYYDMTGKQIKATPVNTRGEEAGITINAGELAPGMYIYALVADGKEIDSKKMIITQ